MEVSVRPRRWQEEAVARWEGAGKRGIVKVVTGAGKTVFAELCIARFMSAFPQGQAVILVPTEALMDQWFVSLREDLSLGEGKLATYSGSGKPREPARVNILILNTARAWAPRILSPPSLLVVDECHRAASPANAKALEGPYTSTLGLSATPEREHDDFFEEVLEPTLGPVIFRYGYADALADGVISHFDLVNVEVPLHPSEEESYQRLTRRIGKLTTSDDVETDERLKQLLIRRAQLSARARYRVPVATNLAASSQGKTIVFHEAISAANAIADQLTSRGVRAALYHSAIPGPHRRDNLRLFRRGAFSVLVTCRALDEGMDVPQTTTAIIASSTASYRQRVQRLGRALRPAKGKPKATVFTLFATLAERDRLLAETPESTGADEIRWMRSSFG